MRKVDLIKFEQEIAGLYEKAKIKAPIHLSGNNETELEAIFRKIKKEDWIFSTWRNHYHWLLSGRSPKGLKQQIVEGCSMHVFGKKFFTSAIVGGIAPIAVGVAYALKKKKSKNRVWCFLGDMGASTGLAMECMRYACGHDLPIVFIIEDNGISVKTDTLESWGCKGCNFKNCNYIGKKTKAYKYERKYPHAGTGVFVLF